MNGMLVSALIAVGFLVIGLVILHFTPHEEPRSKRSDR
jgi:hypothetical protein